MLFFGAAFGAGKAACCVAAAWRGIVGSLAVAPRVQNGVHYIAVRHGVAAIAMSRCHQRKGGEDRRGPAKASCRASIGCRPAT